MPESLARTSIGWVPLPSALMSPPPWVLISPGGLPYLVRDSDDLTQVAAFTHAGRIEVGQLGELRKLIGQPHHQTGIYCLMVRLTNELAQLA